LKGI